MQGKAEPATGTYITYQLLGWALFHALLLPFSLQALASGQESLGRVLLISPLSCLLTLLASHLLYLWYRRTDADFSALRLYWQRLAGAIVFIAISITIVSWLINGLIDHWLPPPATRSPLNTGLFGSFLAYLVNFTIVYSLLLALWWLIFRTLSAGLAQAADQTPGAEPVPALDSSSPVMISDGRQSRLITPAHIEYAFSEGNYVKLIGTELNMLIRATLSHLEGRLRQAGFFRANRQILVNLSKVVSIDEAVSGNTLLVLESGKEIETSRRRGQALKKALTL